MSRTPERGDLDRPRGLVRVRPRLHRRAGEGIREAVRLAQDRPLASGAAESLEEFPVRIDTRLVFPGARGGHLNLGSWAGDNGRLRCEPPASSTAPPTLSATRSPPGRLPPGSASSSSPA